MSLLEVRGVTKRFGGLTANKDVSFDVGPGELVGIIGPNGAGKSTLFDLITGFLAPDAGTVLLDGRPVPGMRPDQVSRQGVGPPFQKRRPFAHRAALENVMVGASQKPADPGEARERAISALGSVGLAGKEDA